MQGALIRNLVEHNLRQGSAQVRQDVRTLLCFLTRDNPVATSLLLGEITSRVMHAVRGILSNAHFVC